MNNNERRPILYKGEAYSTSIDKAKSMRSKPPAVSYEEARLKILHDIGNVNKNLQDVPTDLRLPNEAIVCLRVQKEYVAKTWYPEAIFSQSSDLQEIGSRMWKQDEVLPEKNTQQQEYGRLYFVRTTDQGILNLEKKLNKKESDLYENFKLDIRKISTLDLISADEQVLGFDSEWETGRVEAILHPFYLDRSLALSHFKKLISNANSDTNSINVKQYDEDGLTFISFIGNRNIIKALRGYNPLRTIHPLMFRNIPDITRSSVKSGSPITPTFTKKSPIIAGVIDGGYTTGNPCLDKYVEVVDCVPGKPLSKFQDHGSMVTSAALFGPIHEFSNTDTLPEPAITIRNFRVLSEDTKDPDLYCVIDAIEEIVPKNTDIQCYNISIGPCGPVLDDPISRFTLACDTLSKKHNVLFHVAVGNDGKERYNRIQSPSDIVNGISVGAYTINKGNIEPADYSCEGPGREGNKMKPDIVGFAGCEKFPLQLITSQSNHRTYIDGGTSFASPQSLSFSAQLIGGSKGVINPLSARLLTVHSAKGNKKNKHCNKMGHGILPNDIDEVMSCINKSYTLIYEGELQNGTYRQYSIPWVNEFDKGMVNLRWTVAVLSAVDPNSPEDYTSSSVEVNFYPNSSKYQFSLELPNGKPQTQFVDIDEEPTRAKALLDSGWKQSKTPKSDTASKPYASENELRRDYLKWDTMDVREMSKNVKGIKEPIFHVHAIGRGKRIKDSKVKFAIALTVEVPKGPVDIYQKIRAKYEALLPIRMDIQNVIPVNSNKKI